MKLQFSFISISLLHFRALEKVPSPISLVTYNPCNLSPATHPFPENIHYSLQKYFPSITSVQDLEQE